MCNAFYILSLLNLRVAYNAGCTKTVSIEQTIPALQGQSGAFDSQPVSTFSYLKDLPLMIHTRFEKCRVGLVVCRLSYHKCKHGVMFTRQRNV